MALAAKGKEEPVEIGYRLLDSAEVKRLGIQVLTTNGTLGDKELNKLHRNLTHVTATTLAELANTLAHSPGGIVSEESFDLSRLLYPAKGLQRGSSVDVCLRMVEIVSHPEIAVQQLQCHHRMGRRESARLNPQVLLFPPCPMEFLLEATGDRGVPVSVSEPVVSHAQSA